MDKNVRQTIMEVGALLVLVWAITNLTIFEFVLMVIAAAIVSVIVEYAKEGT